MSEQSSVRAEDHDEKFTDLDPAVLSSLIKIAKRADDHQFVINILQRFIESTPERLHAIAEAAAREDVEDLEFQAHTLKSSCRVVGACTMADICRSLEASGRRGQLAQADEQIRELQRSFATITPHLEQVLASIHH